MAITYVLTPELRIKLKAPIGTLIRGSFAETMKILKDMIKTEKPTTIISVGDAVSKHLAENNVLPHVSIVDNKVMRKVIQPISLSAEKIVHIKNPPGTITDEALEAIRDALESEHCVKIVVDGEEDLLTLAAVLYSPNDSFVIYGQPHEGIVVVKTTTEKRAEISEILKAMENVRKAK